jgi:hypothetical protein
MADVIAGCCGFYQYRCQHLCCGTEAASASMMFIVLAIVFGYAVYRRGVSLKIGTVMAWPYCSYPCI